MRRTPRESAVEDAVCDWAAGHGWLPRKMSYIGRAGAPDRFFFGYGHVVIIEFKRPGKDVADPLQADEHRQLRRHGVVVRLANTVDDGIAILRELTPKC